MLHKTRTVINTIAMLSLSFACSVPNNQPQNQKTEDLHQSTGDVELLEVEPVVNKTVNRDIEKINIITESSKNEKSAVSAKAEGECFEVEFNHKALKSHANREDCSEHQNLVKVEGLLANSNSVCVRVDGKPTRFKRYGKAGDQLLLSSDLGPKTVISVRFCNGAVHCADDCSVPKDEFMESIGAEEEFAESNRDDLNLNQDLKLEMANLDREAIGTMTQEGLFKGWDRKESKPASCKNTKPVLVAKRGTVK